MMRKLSAFLLAFIIATSLLALLHTTNVDAVSGSEWSAGRIIDDFVFTNKNSMSPDQIQAFLNSTVGTGGYGRVAGQCDTNGVGTSEYGGGSRAQYGASHNNPSPFTCLKEYYEVPKLNPGAGIPASNYGGKPIPAGARSAAQLIWDASQRYNISPKVLLVTIQKESAGPLTTDDWPFKSQYTYAMGAHCPDSGPGGTANCDSNYAGFSIQISESARLMRYYLDNMDQSWWPYKKPGVNYIQYNPNTVCGGTNVYVLTKATAALYTYTPYQPNAVALSNVYGSQTDGCSSYGNRNFWRIYRDWFGLTYANDSEKVHPDGTIISDTVRIFIMENGQRRHITNPYVFNSYGYKWSDVVESTTGDRLSVISKPINTLAPGTLIKSDNTPVYITDYDGNVIKKRYVSLDAFNNLGYKWEDVMYIPPSVMPPTHQTPLPIDQHPSGSLIQSQGRIFLIESSHRRHVNSSEVFESRFYKWSNVKQATQKDMLLPLGAILDFREGTILNANGLFLVDYDSVGIMKRPIGPWECYADRMHFTSVDWIYVATSSLPVRTGALFTC